MFDVTPFLLPERHAFVDLLRGLDPDQWDAATECPHWTVKGVALHLLGDDLSLLSRQRDAATNGLLTYAVDHPGLTFPELLDGFNEQWVHAAGFFSTALVVELLAITGTWTADYYGAADPLALGEPVGFFGAYGQPSPHWQAHAREYIERWIHHSQIRRALGLGPVDSEFSAPAIEAFVLGLGTRNPGIGSFTIGERTWEFRDAAALSLDPDLAQTVLSRGLPFEETVPAYTGDPALVEDIASQTCQDLLRVRAERGLRP